MRLTALAVASAFVAGAAAADPAAIRLAAGVSYPYDRQTRTALGDPGSIDWKDGWGSQINLGFSAPQPGFIGQPWLEFAWARQENDSVEARIDTVGVLYLERFPFGSPVWVGLGPGSFYTDLHIGDVEKKTWRIGGRATLGFSVWGPLALEAGYSYSGEVKGVKTDTFDLTLGIAF